jgi:hypothetical protein
MKWLYSLFVLGATISPALCGPVDSGSGDKPKQSLHKPATSAALGAEVTSADKPERDLDKVAEQYLLYPPVLDELRLTDKQTMLLVVRQLVVPLRQMAKQATAGGSDDASSVPDFGSNPLSNLHGLLFLRRTDLSDRQRARLRQIAMQADPLSALCTSQVAFALQLSSKQTVALDKIYMEHAAKSRVLFTAKLNGTAKLMEIVEKIKAGEDSGSANSDPKEAAKAFDREFDSLEQMLVDVFCQSMPFLQRSDRDQKRIHDQLTGKQWRVFRELAGKPVKLHLSLRSVGG